MENVSCFLTLVYKDLSRIYLKIPWGLAFVFFPGFCPANISTPPNIGTAPGNILRSGFTTSVSSFSSLSASNRSSDSFSASFFTGSVTAGATAFC